MTFGPFLQDLHGYPKGRVLGLPKTAMTSKILLLASIINFLVKPLRLRTYQHLCSNLFSTDFWLLASNILYRASYPRSTSKNPSFSIIPTGFPWDFYRGVFESLGTANDIKNFAFSFNHWLSDQTLAIGDLPTCLFELVQSRFLIVDSKNFISSLLSTLCKQKSIDFDHSNRIPLGLL